MILAGFSKSDSVDEIVRQQVRRRLALKLHQDRTLLVAVMVPPVAVVMPPVAVVVPRSRAARCLLCSLAANRRKWTLPRHSGVAHDVYMERVPLDVPNGG